MRRRAVQLRAAAGAHHQPRRPGHDQGQGQGHPGGRHRLGSGRGGAGWLWLRRRGRRLAGGALLLAAGRYQAGTHYSLELAAGIQDEFGQKAASLAGEASTNDLEPSVEVGPDIALIEAGGDGALPLHTVNVSTVTATLRALSPAEMARRLGRNVQPAGASKAWSATIDSTRILPNGNRRN